jgi:YesN/AraC family two-component response regulator
MPYEEALSLSDLYIQHSEKHTHAGQILNLQQNMVLDYATQVHNLTMGHSYNQFMRSVTSYIHEHLTEDVTVSRIANDLYLSRSYLSTKFKQESGMTLNSFIQKLKIKKAREYLRNTDRSILEISTYLGFSSQGYFQNVFKNVTGSTPKEYRESNFHIQHFQQFM